MQLKASQVLIMCMHVSVKLYFKHFFFFLLFESISSVVKTRGHKSDLYDLFNSIQERFQIWQLSLILAYVGLETCNDPKKVY